MPERLLALYPEVNFTRSERWNNFTLEYSGVWTVDPSAPLFRAIGKAFVDTQNRLLQGKAWNEAVSDLPFVTHLYAMDQFNEMKPPTTDHSFLKQTSKVSSNPLFNAVFCLMCIAGSFAVQTIFEAMRAADPRGVWLAQAWLFQDKEWWLPPRIEAYLSGVPNDGMIVLDL